MKDDELLDSRQKVKWQGLNIDFNVHKTNASCDSVDGLMYKPSQKGERHYA